MIAVGSEKLWRAFGPAVGHPELVDQTVFPFAIGTRLELKPQVDGTLLALATVATSDPQVGNAIQFPRMLPEDIDELRAFLDSAQKSE